MNKKIRTAVRIVVLNEDKDVLLVHSTKGDYYQLPGGGVDLEKETPQEAAVRETLEETGYAVAITDELGTFEEIGDTMINKSFGYVAKLSDTLDKRLNEDEEDFINEWMPIALAREVFKKSLDENVGGKFESFFRRELEFINRTVKLDNI